MIYDHGVTGYISLSRYMNQVHTKVETVKQSEMMKAYYVTVVLVTSWMISFSIIFVTLSIHIEKGVVGGRNNLWECFKLYT